MHFRNLLEITLAALSCQTVLGNPVASRRTNPLAARATVPKTRADAFANSGADFETWAKRMVDEGKMWYPEKRSVQVRNSNAKMETVVVRHADGSHSLGLERRKTNLKLNNIVCEGLGGKEEVYQKGREKFCRAMRDAIAGVARGFEFALQQALCNGGETCDFIVELGVTAWTAMAQLELPEECGPLFDQVREACSGLSGAAQVIVEGPRGELGDLCGPPTCMGDGVATNIGHFEAQFFEHDSGWRCPAPTDELVCKNELF
ncbi:hypothetical protein B0H66DRAFT_228361 [Apodospora peruviana]|uniref:Uncharacterized protein n=1 Tax=Apodospora peruviana TaxID=516989 RepID=A0AAE0M3V1_9PEZI|nr:hypothetical protein B0H66DRAFT_228361 [Apodospora peruviana]